MVESLVERFEKLVNDDEYDHEDDRRFLIDFKRKWLAEQTARAERG